MRVNEYVITEESKKKLEERVARELKRGFKVEVLGTWVTGGSRGLETSVIYSIRERAFNCGPHMRAKVRITRIEDSWTRDEFWWFEPDRKLWRKS